MTRRLRVDVVGGFATLGGAERWLLALLDGTDRLDCSAVLLSDGPLTAALSERDVPVAVRPTGSSARALAAAARGLRRRWRRTRPDVVLANGVKAAAAAVPAARLAGAPVVWAKHDFSYDRALARPLGRAADAVVAVSAGVAAATGRADAVIVPPPLPGWVAARPDHARAFWARRGVHAGGPTVAMLGRLVAYKGVDRAIAALAHPAAAAWRLVVIGDDDPAAPGEQERLRRLATAAGVDGRVVFTGDVPDAGRWLAAFDAVAVLTRREGPFGGEGYSLVALEAAHAGVPLIAGHDAPEAARLAAVAVDPRDAAAVAAALARARGATPPRLEAHPDAAACASRLAQVLAEVARRPGAGLPGGPPVSVVTTVRDEGRGVEQLLARLAPQLGPTDELVLVDGGSTDDTLPRARAWAAVEPRITVVAAPGTNIPAGRNVGVRAARHDVIACTDAGCTPVPAWLEALRSPFGEPVPPALVTGIYRVQARGAIQRAVAVACYPDPAEARHPGLLVRAYGRLLGRTYDPTTPTGRSVAFTRAAWAGVGGFPEHLATGEDVTFGRAIASAGHRCVLAADAEVAWDQRPSLAATAQMFFRYGVGGGRSRDRLVVGRDLVRAAAYGLGPAVAVKGGRAGRGLLAAGALAYLSLPLARVRRHGYGPGVAALVPAALALKDLTKAAGCLVGLVRRSGSATAAFPSPGGRPPGDAGPP